MSRGSLGTIAAFAVAFVIGGALAATQCSIPAGEGWSNVGGDARRSSFKELAFATGRNLFPDPCFDIEFPLSTNGGSNAVTTPPVLVDGMACTVVVSGTGSVVCYHLNGTVAHNVSLHQTPDWQNQLTCSPPSIAGGANGHSTLLTVYCTTDSVASGLFAFEFAGGVLAHKWTSAAGLASSNGAIGSADGQYVYSPVTVSNGLRTVAALHVVSGDVAWYSVASDLISAQQAEISVGHNGETILWSGTGGGSSGAISATTGEFVWTKDFLSPNFGPRNVYPVAPSGDAADTVVTLGAEGSNPGYGVAALNITQRTNVVPRWTTYGQCSEGYTLPAAYDKGAFVRCNNAVAQYSLLTGQAVASTPYVYSDFTNPRGPPPPIVTLTHVFVTSANRCVYGYDRTTDMSQQVMSYCVTGQSNGYSMSYIVGLALAGNTLVITTSFGIHGVAIL